MKARRLMMVGILATATGVLADPGSATFADSPTSLMNAIALRSDFGLSTDPNAVASLMGSTADVGSKKWGIPMTFAEEADIDLRGRMTFADAVDRRLLPYLRGLSGYAGIYIDQQRAGSLVVMLTLDQPDVTNEIAARLEGTTRGFHIKRVAHSEAQILAALDKARDVWSTVTFAELASVGVDHRINGLRFVASPGRAPDLAVLAGQLRDKLDVSVVVDDGLQDHDTGCTSRDSCYDPMRAGIWIYKGQVDSVPECTMAFHIVIGTNEHFTTAGHCGYSGSNSWLTRPLGVIGSELGTLYRDGGQDIMYVSMTDTQASQFVYACCTDILGYAYPIQNEAVCASLGRTNAIKCGTVTSTWVSYLSDTPNPDIHVWGGDTSIATINGDSGSPVYRINDRNQATAIGVNTTEFGQFARLDSSLDDWSALVVK